MVKKYDSTNIVIHYNFISTRIACIFSVVYKLYNIICLLAKIYDFKQAGFKSALATGVKFDFGPYQSETNYISEVI